MSEPSCVRDFPALLGRFCDQRIRPPGGVHPSQPDNSSGFPERAWLSDLLLPSLPMPTRTSFPSAPSWLGRYAPRGQNASMKLIMWRNRWKGNGRRGLLLQFPERNGCALRVGKRQKPSRHQETGFDILRFICSVWFGVLRYAIDPERRTRLIGSPASGDRPADGIRDLRRYHRHDQEASDGRDAGVMLREPDEQHRATAVRALHQRGTPGPTVPIEVRRAGELPEIFDTIDYDATHPGLANRHRRNLRRRKQKNRCEAIRMRILAHIRDFVADRFASIWVVLNRSF